MPAHVEPHAPAEGVRPQVVLDHAHHRGTLLVGDGVEVLGRLGHAPHPGVDRVGVGERVHAERGRAVVLEALPHAPLGPPVGDHTVRHPGGERLVQPEVVPPRHGDQVAVPHVCELVRDHLGGPLALGERGRRRIEEEERLAEEDGARVLHRARLEVRDRDQVELAVGVGNPEVVLETAEPLGGGRAESRQRVDPINASVRQVVGAAGPVHDRAVVLGTDHDKADPRMPHESIDEARERRVDRLPRRASRHARKRDLREIPRRGNDDVRRLLGVVARTGVMPERRARQRPRHPVDARRLR